PYLGSGGVWALAGRIAARSGDPVLVAAPPPRLARRVNNKIWFTQRAEELLGPRSVPSSRETYSLAILAGAVRDLARDHDRIGIKLPIAAGGAGNVVIDTASLRELPLTVIRDRLARLLARAAWGDPFPLLVSVWESPVVLSPSVQLWIPHAVDGPPIVEGIFEQRSSGLIGRFIGAVPAELPGALRERIAAEAALIGLLFQQLGYFGRCSFDAILVGERLEDAELHWVECNGRWGGTSIPMTLVNRLTGDWATAPFVIAHPEGCPRLPFAEVLDRTADLLFRPGARSPGVVYLSPGGFDPEGGLKSLVIARDPGGAQREADEVVARLRA